MLEVNLVNAVVTLHLNAARGPPATDVQRPDALTSYRQCLPFRRSFLSDIQKPPGIAYNRQGGPNMMTRTSATDYYAMAFT